MEFCGGIHAHDIQELGMVKIISEGSISAGVRRIEGTTSKTAFEMLQKQDMEASAVQGILKQKEEIGTRVQSLMEQIKQQEKELKKLKSELSKKEVEHLFTDVPTVNELPYVVASFEDLDGKTFRTMSDQLVQKLNSGALVLFNADGEKVSLICRFTDDWVKKGMDANKLLRPLAEMVGGKGGGRPNMAQAGGTDPSRIPQAREKVADFLKDLF
jgi:alanyl-tRNA synthetase